ncbi:hypothetical protein LCGC14_3079050 [marine sediment metagenome]|uniref:Uncharacterized protein n=1 Tax=marine sediment metagenome TaxID=412755 RepID=A0A0F8YLF5_9ZZZZ
MSIRMAIKTLGDVSRGLQVPDKVLKEACRLAAQALTEKLTMRSSW